MSSINELVGKVIKSINSVDDCELIFRTQCGLTYLMHHEQDCCEDVRIDDICGDIKDLIDTVICSAEESTNEGDPKEYSESHLWTFYNFRTHKGDVSIKWYGESNGYYSESVEFELIKKEGK